MSISDKFNVQLQFEAAPLFVLLLLIIYFYARVTQLCGLTFVWIETKRSLDINN